MPEDSEIDANDSQLLKALFPIVFKLSGKETDVKGQWLNAHSPIDWSPSGNVIDDNEEQSAKEELPIDCRLSGKETDVNEEQFWTKRSPNDKIPEGSVKVVNDEHLLNDPFPIVCKPSGSVIDVSDVQPEKVYSPLIVWRLSGSVTVANEEHPSNV